MDKFLLHPSPPVKIWQQILDHVVSVGQFYPAYMIFLYESSLAPGGRNQCPKTPFLFSLDHSSTMLMGLPWIPTVKLSKSRRYKAEAWYLFTFQEKLCNPAGFKRSSWSSQNDLYWFFMRYITHRDMDTFSIGSVVAAQQVV